MILAARHYKPETQSRRAGGTFSGAANSPETPTFRLPRPPFCERAMEQLTSTETLPARPFLIGGQKLHGAQHGVAADHPFMAARQPLYGTHGSVAGGPFSRGAATANTKPTVWMPLRTPSRRRAVISTITNPLLPAATHDTQGVTHD